MDSRGNGGSKSSALPSSHAGISGRTDTGATKSQREKTWAIPSVGNVDRSGNVTFPEVSNLELARLRNLLEDDDVFDTFCSENVAGIKTLNTVLRDLVKNNEVAARKNLSHEEDIKSLQEEVAGLREVLQEKQASYAKLVERQDALARKMSPIELVRKVESAVEAAHSCCQNGRRAGWSLLVARDGQGWCTPD